MAVSQARSFSNFRVKSMSLAEGVITIRARGRLRRSARSIVFATRSGPAPSLLMGPSYAPLVIAATLALNCA